MENFIEPYLEKIVFCYSDGTKDVISELTGKDLEVRCDTDTVNLNIKGGKYEAFVSRAF